MWTDISKYSYPELSTETERVNRIFPEGGALASFMKNAICFSPKLHETEPFPESQESIDTKIITTLINSIENGDVEKYMSNIFKTPGAYLAYGEINTHHGIFRKREQPLIFFIFYSGNNEYHPEYVIAQAQQDTYNILVPKLFRPKPINRLEAFLLHRAINKYSGSIPMDLPVSLQRSASSKRRHQYFKLCAKHNFTDTQPLQQHIIGFAPYIPSRSSLSKN